MFFVFQLIFAATLAFASPVSTLVQRLGPGKQIYTQVVGPENGKPTFLLMPGVVRGPFLNEDAAQELIKEGYGVVAFNFSVQPLSIATLPQGEKPAFNVEEPTLDTLAGEAEALARSLVGQYGINQILPVSLSYSGAVSSRLRSFARVIDSVPLTSLAAFNPQLAAYRNWLKAGEIMNPIYGPSITRASLDQSYRSQWTGQVDGMIEPFRLPKERRLDMIEGYVRLSRTSEGYEWTSGGDAARRTFIFGEKESSALLSHQMQVARQRLVDGRPESVVIVKETGHMVFGEFPLIYVEILKRAVTGTLPQGVTVITPSTGQWQSLPMRESLDLLGRGSL